MQQLLPAITDYANTVNRMYIGAEQYLKRLHEAQLGVTGTVNYPPYNIVKTGDDTYVVEVAVAGFSKQDIDIEVNNCYLKITGKISDKSETSNYIHRGIATRAFTRSFSIADDVVVKGAELVNGMLRVNLECVVPESRRARKIVIN
jgi:molecular chaperone IbpA